jgi:glycerophosphoryl diester phosphodiesterase
MPIQIPDRAAANAWLNASNPLIVAHRGASTLMPENSLAACSLACEQGADGIEVDVQLSKDGCPVLVHDAALADLTGNPREVKKMLAAELQQEDLGEGQTIARLEELFESLGDTTRYNIELKDFGWPDQDLIDRVAALVAQFGLEPLILISSFNPLVVRRAQSSFPDPVAVALLRAPGLMRFTNHLARTEVDNPHYSLVDETYAAWARSNRLHVFAWTVDDVDEAVRLLACGVNGIITNEPAKLGNQLALRTASS